MRRGCSRLALSLSLALVAPPALADPSAADRATARTLAQEGQHALEGKNYNAAIDKFTRADTLVHAPTLLLGLARAQVGSGRLVEAQENYNRIIREGVAAGAPKSWTKAVEDANKEVGAISSRIPWVTITVLGPSNPEVVIDSTPIPNASLGVKRAINPGSHKIKVSAEGFHPVEKSIAMTEGQSLAVNLELDAVPDATPPPEKTAPAVAVETSTPGGGEWRKTLTYVAFGVGGAGLIVGGVSGALAYRKHGELEDVCPNGQCPERYASARDNYYNLASIANVGFIVGGVGIVTGTILLLTQPKTSSASASARWTPVIGLNSIGVTGTFQ